MFELTEFDPDEVHGFMDSREAAAFLGLPYASFKEIASGLPRHAGVVRVLAAGTAGSFCWPVAVKGCASVVYSV